MEVKYFRPVFHLWWQGTGPPKEKGKRTVARHEEVHVDTEQSTTISDVSVEGQLKKGSAINVTLRRLA